MSFNLQDPSTASAERLAATVEAVNQQGLLVIGSIGRAVLFDQVAGDPNLEFAARGEDPLVAGDHARDVDVIGGLVEESVYSYMPHVPDVTWFKGPRQSLWPRGDTWDLMTHVGPTTVLDGNMFEPVEGTTVFGIPCRTVGFAMHIALLTGNKPKHEIARSLLVEHAPTDEIDKLTSPEYKALVDVLELNLEPGGRHMRKLVRGMAGIQDTAE